MKTLLFIACLTLVGCAHSSGVVPMGPDTFMISKQAGTGFAGLGTMKADALQEANEYCVKNGKQMNIVSSSESAPPYILGNFPRVEINFMCLKEGDNELARPKMIPVRNPIVEINK